MTDMPHRASPDGPDEWDESLDAPSLAAGYPLSEELIEDTRIGQLLIRYRLINLEQLQQMLEAQEARPSELLGELAVDFGFVSLDDIQDVLRLQLSELRLGQILVKTRCVTQEQLDIALTEQDNSGELLGSILISFGFCTAEKVAWAIDAQSRD